MCFLQPYLGFCSIEIVWLILDNEKNKNLLKTNNKKTTFVLKHIFYPKMLGLIGIFFVYNYYHIFC